jgi:chromosomal replication initiator protein
MDPQATWQKIQNHLKQNLTQHNYKTWFGKTEARQIENGQIILAVPNAFVKGQQLLRYGPLLNETIQAVIGNTLTITYTIDPSLDNKKNSTVEEEEDDDLFTVSSPLIPKANTSINKKYTIQNFVVGPTNNLAFAAAQAIIQNPGQSYNPFFMYGPSGVGKTHLMHAIGNAILEKNPSAKLVFVSSERFLNDFVESIQRKGTTAFRQKYRDCDCLLVDDIQFIAGKDSFQEEFFHTFNELHTKNAQIVLTSDRPPNELTKLEDRLRSRFQGGLMVDLQLPDFETRVAILKAKLVEKGQTLPEESLTLIAESIQSNTRELEGKLIQILETSKLLNQEPTVEFVSKHLGGHQMNQNQKIDHKKLLSTVNDYFNLRMADITGPRRQKELVLPRQIAMYLMQTECNMPFEKIGQVLGGRDHTTVMHGVEKIKMAIARDREVQRLVLEIKQNLTN